MESSPHTQSRFRKTKRLLAKRQYNTVNVDDYVFMRTTHPYHGDNSKIIEFVVPTAATLRELGVIGKDFMARRTPGFNNIKAIYYTRDEQMKIPLGKPTDLVKDVVDDGQLIYLAFLLEGNKWVPTVIEEDPKESGCYHCRQPITGHYIKDVPIGFRRSPVCYDCLSLAVFSCCHCYASGAKLMIDDETGYRMECPPGKKCEPSPDRVCGYCTIPLDHRYKCGRCRIVAYCSEACQQRNWEEHKKTCVKREKKGAPDVD